MGVFVVVGMLAVVASLFLLTDPASLRGRYLLITAVPDAGGVRRGDPILMKGVNIGRVSGFEMTEDELVTITMEIEGQWEIPEDSRTLLAGAGLLGGQTLEIVRGTSSVPAEENDTLLGVGQKLGVMESAQQVAERADDVLGRLQQALDHGTVAAVQGSAADLQQTMTDLRGLAAAQRVQLAHADRDAQPHGVRPRARRPGRREHARPRGQRGPGPEPDQPDARPDRDARSTPCWRASTRGRGRSDGSRATTRST